MHPVAGVDIGSVATKAVVVQEGGAVGRALSPTGADPVSAAEAALADALEAGHLRRRDLAAVVATGYGRRRCGFADRAVTEITAAARGLRAAGIEAATIIDLGGQDSKVIALDDDGMVRNFLMNDKCAAGTGRFLEVMAKVLGVTVEGLDRLSGASKGDVRLNSTCTVFAETEVISLIHSGAAREEIARALHEAVASRLAAMVRRAGCVGRAAFIGGGARSECLRRALERALGVEVVVPPDPQFVVALGAAMTASDCR